MLSWVGLSGGKTTHQHPGSMILDLGQAATRVTGFVHYNPGAKMPTIKTSLVLAAKTLKMDRLEKIQPSYLRV